MVQPLVIVGAGGFGRELLDVVRASNEAGHSDFELLGMLDDGDPDRRRLQHLGVSLLGPCAVAADLPAGSAFLIGIGAPGARADLDRRMTDAGLIAVAVVHPRATIGAEVHLGDGTVVCAGAVLTTNIRTGRHCQVHVNAAVGHDCTFGDRVTVSPGAAVSGDVVLEDDVTVGTSACITQGLTIGAGSVVGAGAAVVRPVPAGVVVVGVPARESRRLGAGGRADPS